MVYIYILELTDGKYYIGKTNYSNFSLNVHFNSNESTWTNKYKPIKLLELFENNDDYDEDKYTLMYMHKYGIDNVRGGTFTRIQLSKSSLEHLNLMSNCKNNKSLISIKEYNKIKDLTYFDDIIKDKYDPIIMNDDFIDDFIDDNIELITFDPKINEESKCFGCCFIHCYKNNYLLNNIIKILINIYKNIILFLFL